MKEGRLISFEGVDGAGKTTQLDLLEDWLKSCNIPYIRTREPGGTARGVEIRKILLTADDPKLKISPLAEVLLFQADRTRHFDKVVLPALEAGKLVITDRCFDASIAYQGYGRGVDIELIEYLSLLAMQGRIPDLTILFDLGSRKAHKRVGVSYRRIGVQLLLPFGVREERDRLDVETQDFHRRVRDGFRDLARTHAERIKKIDASFPIEQIHQSIIDLIKPLLPTDTLTENNYPCLFESNEENIEPIF